MIGGGIYAVMAVVFTFMMFAMGNKNQDAEEMSFVSSEEAIETSEERQINVTDVDN